MNERKKEIIGAEIFLILILAVALGKKLTDAELDRDLYAKISMIAGGLGGGLLWGIIIAKEIQDNGGEKQLNGFDLLQLPVLMVLTSLLAQAIRHSAPYLKDGATSLIFSQKKVTPANANLQQDALDNTSNLDQILNSRNFYAHI